MELEDVFRALAGPEPSEPPRCVARARWPGAGRARGAAAGDDPLRRHEASPHPGGSQPGDDPPRWASQAALPQPRSDPAHRGPLDQPLCPAVDRGDGRSEERPGGARQGGQHADGCTAARIPGLHSGHSGAPVAGDHGPGHDADLLLQLARRFGLRGRLADHLQAAGRQPGHRRQGPGSRPASQAGPLVLKPLGGERGSADAPSPGRSRRWAARPACYR